MKYTVVVCFACIIIIAIGVIISKRKKNASSLPDPQEESSPTMDKTALAVAGNTELSVRFESLQALTEGEEARLVEVTDHKLLSRIDGAIPGILQAAANTGAVHQYKQAVQSAGQLYQVIIPKGAVLANSKSMDGAVRGIFHGANGIKGHANLVAVDGNMGGGLAAMNVANAAMGVAAMVVGQYYMTQINQRLDSISDGIDKIADFQNNEYKSKVYALVAEIQKISTFQLETMENDELRNRELLHLQNLEHECAQLLGQANITLQTYSQKADLEYKQYEKYVREANSWYQYQQLLLEIMGKIGELIYALNLGAVSKEYCYAMRLPYAKQLETTLEQLNKWHMENGERLGIDVASTRRKRQGIEGLVMNIPALLNNDFHYKPISRYTAAMISSQTDGVAKEKPSDDPDLFREDVRLVAKGEKLFYLPNA